MGFNLDKLAEMAKPRAEKAKMMAQKRKENKEWLRMSQDIALSLHYYLRKMKMTQKQLAEKMGVSPAYIGKLLKGGENLTLETICYLQQATGQEFISISRPYEHKEIVSPTQASISQNTIRSATYCSKQMITTDFSPVSGDVA